MLGRRTVMKWLAVNFFSIACVTAFFQPIMQCGFLLMPMPRCFVHLILGTSHPAPASGLFQSSPAINYGCHSALGINTAMAVLVSILTHDQLRVSRKRTCCHTDTGAVSILTRDQLRVSLGYNLNIVPLSGFQSSPAINCGCHRRPQSRARPPGCFNPHPRSTAGVTLAKPVR